MDNVVRLNPPQLPVNPAFSQGVSVEGQVRTVYVGGQNAVSADGAVVGDDAATQTAAALENLEHVLAAAGARLEDVVSWSIYLVEGQSLQDGFAGFQRVWGRRADPPAASFAFVSGLANPRFLVEISAIAAVSVRA